MELNNDFCLYYINILNKYIGKTNSKKVINSIVNYTTEYAEINQTPFLVEDIFKTKFDELYELFSKNTYLQTLIKNKEIKPENICNLQPEELDPIIYNHIIKKKKN